MKIGLSSYRKSSFSFDSPMSALGHKRTSQDLDVMSALPPKADIDELSSCLLASSPPTRLLSAGGGIKLRAGASVIPRFRPHCTRPRGKIYAVR